MLDASRLRRLESLLISRAGGYLRNPIREQSSTCFVCTTPVDGYARCRPCQNHFANHRDQLADAVALMTYGVSGSQAAYVMRGYKATPPIQEHITTLTLLTWLAVGLHTACAGKLVGLPVTHWTTVPSLPSKPGEHPFHRIVSTSPPSAREVTLLAAPGVADPRHATAAHFTTPTALPARSHVLILDDTWTTGGHAQSAALTLRQAGAAKVSILVAARWINRGFGNNEEFVRQRLRSDYSAQTCPWTGTACP